MAIEAGSGRPSYWDIAVAYLEEGYRAWHARDEASADTVESRLGLSWQEGLRFRDELAGQGLIEPVRNLGRTVYNLAPRGLAFVERMPDVQRLLAMQTMAINSSSSGPDEKRQATFSLRDEVYKTALSKGADAVIQNAGAIWNTVRTVYSNLPEQWKV
jgi:predicted transcriptional regulator